MLSEKYIPVIAPIGVDHEEQSYSINTDTVAAEVAAALKAEKLIMLTDVPGVIKTTQMAAVKSSTPSWKAKSNN